MNLELSNDGGMEMWILCGWKCVQCICWYMWDYGYHPSTGDD